MSKTRRELDREIKEALGSGPALTSAGVVARMTGRLTSEGMLALMIGRRVKSGWHGITDGEILEWEPFGAGGTDVHVKDLATGRTIWLASHGLTPIDHTGPLPSRSEIRKLREAEMKSSMEKIAERWAKEPRPSRIRR